MNTPDKLIRLDDEGFPNYGISINGVVYNLITNTVKQQMLDGWIMLYNNGQYRCFNTKKLVAKYFHLHPLNEISDSEKRSLDWMNYSQYTIVSDGRVWSDICFRWLIPFSANDYLFVTLKADAGGRKMFPIHRLVALSFIPNPENKPEVNHIDGNKRNNSVANLEWVTGEENRAHAVSIGLVRQLSTEEVRDIRSRLNLGESVRAIASDYGVHIQTIYHIKYGRSHRDV